MPDIISISCLKRIVVVLCWVAFLPAIELFGASFIQYTQLTEAHGLPASSIRIIAQDDEGVIWIGLENNGICRFDGHGYVLYNESSKGGRKLSENHAKRIVDDGKGNLWIATLGGLNRLDKESDAITLFKHDPSDPQSLADNRLRDIEIDSHGRLWLGSFAGVVLFDPVTEIFELLSPLDSGEEITRIFDLYTDADGMVWVMAESGLYVIDPETKRGRDLSHLELMGGGTVENFYCATADHNGRMWIGSDVGVLYLDKESDVFNRLDWSDETGKIEGSGLAYAALTDRKGNVWLGMAKDGLLILDPERETVFTRRAEIGIKAGFTAEAIRALFEDRDGRVWIGSKFNGVHIYDPLTEVLGNRRFLSKSDERKYAHIVAVDVDSRGIIWLGTMNSGLIRFDPKTEAIRYFLPKDLYDGEENPRMIRGVLVDDDDDVFVASGYGFSVVRDDGERIDYGGMGVNCRGFLETKSGQIYMASTTGIFEIDKDSMRGTRLGTNDKRMKPLADVSGQTLFEDSKENLWVATEAEYVYRYSETSGKVERFDSLIATPTFHEAIDSGRSFYEQNERYLWIASKTKGLVKYDTETNSLQRYGTEDGLLSGSVYGILEAGNGDFWLSSDRGLTHFDEKTSEFTNYNMAYGIQGQNFESNAQCVDQDGIFYFGGENGINCFDPSKIKKATPRGDLIFSTITVGADVVVRNQRKAEPLTLSYDENQIMFDFALLDYSYLGQNEYSYRMSGIDMGWINSGRRHIAPYNSLPSGAYTFTVRAKNPEENWGAGTREISFDFYIAPPFWQTTVFRVIVSLLIIGLLVGGFTWIILRGKRTKRRLQALVDARTVDLQKANEKLQDQKTVLEERAEEIDRQNQELELSRDGLEELVQERTKELAAAKEKAEESDRLKTAFLANMSHEIRTPLNAIMGFSQILSMEESVDEEHGGHLDAIRNSAQLLLSLINDMLDLAVIESGQPVVSISPIELNTFFSEQSFEFDQMITNSNVEYRENIALGESCTMINSDPVRIKQILNNFMSNARKFTESGFIEFRVYLEDDQVVCCVSDSGRGIASSDLDQVFNRFYKVTDSKKKYIQGTGLGLSLSKNLSELLGGKIWVESELDQGARFYFSIPLK